MFADARQVEHERLLELQLHPVADIWLIFSRTGSAGGEFLATRPSSSQFADHSIFMGLPVIRTWDAATVCFHRGGGDEVVVLVRPRLVVIAKLRQFGVAEDHRQPVQTPALIASRVCRAWSGPIRPSTCPDP